ncbi:hypothetical protein T03_2264 [Trichinella britovi]|uniref:Domain of unknown function DB domain-containing protein n=1 Tax=Trichinella britovi TaxID=45882 RepID=A0A0V1CDS2_TRIBR|nr:hypothetical protein T03_2264 [Trichinella britovi]KRZ86753.1 hypothetical protein T08_1615 [Trichinella sp. T8]
MAPLLIYALLVSQIALCLSVKFPACDVIGCGYCGTRRMQKECKEFCDSKCSRKNKLINGTKSFNEFNGPSRRVSREVANQQFMNCCQNLDPPVPEACLKICTLDNSPKEFKNIAFKKPKCPMKHLRRLLTCAAGTKDVRSCCEKDESMLGNLNHCIQFCYPSNDDLWDSRFYGKGRFVKCMDKVPLYSECFYEHWYLNNADFQLVSSNGDE